MKLRIALAAALTSVPLLLSAAPAIAAPSPAPSGFCTGSSATYPWGAGTLWHGKVFIGKGNLVNRTAVGDIIPGTITRVSDNRWRIDYPGLPVTDYIVARGDGKYDGTIRVNGTPAGVFALQCH